MFLILFFILSFLASLSIVLMKNKMFARIVTISFAALHLAFTGYCWRHANETILNYFTLDKTGLLLLSVLSLLTITTVYHGFIYVKNDTVKRYTIYHAALIALIVSMSGAYLANGMTVVWIFVEATTLTVSVLIYHDRTALSLEATWKYIFICSIGITLAYIGILFLGFTVNGSLLFELSFSSLPQIVSQVDPLYLKIAFVFILVGYSTKMGLFPMHASR